MEQLIIIAVVSASISSQITFFIVKQLNNAKNNIYIEQAKSRAKVIEHEATTILKDAKLKAKRDYDKEFYKNKKELDEQLYNLERQKEQIQEMETEVKALQNGFKSQHKE